MKGTPRLSYTEYGQHYSSNQKQKHFYNTKKQISALTHKLLWHSAFTLSYIVS